jgi:hypothetical protein
MSKRRKPEDIPKDELLLYDMASQRWKHIPVDQVLSEAATLFNLAVFMAQHGIRKLESSR